MYNPFDYTARVDPVVDVLLLLLAGVLAFGAGLGLLAMVARIEERLRGHPVEIRSWAAWALALSFAALAITGTRHLQVRYADEEIGAANYEMIAHYAVELPGFQAAVDSVLRPDGRITRAEVAVLRRSWSVRKQEDDARRIANAKKTLGN